MPNKNRELARRRLQKAEHDLITARQPLLVPNGPTDTVCFHAQQAVERALKAWLTFCDISFPRTHDLVRLLDLSLAVFPAMEEHREKLADLTEFAVDVRYPEGLPEPSREEALGTLSMAEGIVDQIRQKVHEASSNPEEDRH